MGNEQFSPQQRQAIPPLVETQELPSPVYVTDQT